VSPYFASQQENDTNSILGLAIDYRKTEAEQGMLLNLHKRGWTEGLKMRDHSEMHEGNEQAVKVGLASCCRRDSRLTGSKCYH
jgi:hypothetical protein